jgi:hypothetical protein
MMALREALQGAAYAAALTALLIGVALLTA